MQDPTSFRSRIVWAVLVLGLLVLQPGCATTQEDSDIPWNTPQPWEGSPSIPGLSDR